MTTDPTVLQVYNALLAAVKSIKKSAGYQFDLPDANIYGEFNDEIMSRQKDSDYPKAFMLLETGSSQEGAQILTTESISFSVIVVVKKLSKTDDAANVKVMKFLEDIRRMCSLNYRLGGLVDSIRLGQYTTDAGYNDPEGVVMCELACSYTLEGSPI